jgi:hypothetical protein
MPLNGNNPAYYNIVFDVARFVHGVTLVGTSYGDFNESKNWIVTVGDKTGTQITQNNVVG